MTSAEKLTCFDDAERDTVEASNCVHAVAAWRTRWNITQEALVDVYERQNMQCKAAALIGRCAVTSCVRTYAVGGVVGEEVAVVAGAAVRFG